MLLDFYPLIRHSLISYHVEMGDKEIEIGLVNPSLVPLLAVILFLKLLW